MKISHNHTQSNMMPALLDDDDDGRFNSYYYHDCKERMNKNLNQFISRSVLIERLHLLSDETLEVRKGE